MISPVLARSEDFLNWLLPHTARWPKVHRIGVTSRLEGATVDLVHCLAAANRMRGVHRLRALDEADGHLDSVRILMRVGLALRHLSKRQHEFAARGMEEIGRLIGGWKRVTGEGPD